MNLKAVNFEHYEKHNVRVIEIDDRDWERYCEFQRLSLGWDRFISDLDQRRKYGSPAHGPILNHQLHEDWRRK